MGAVEIVREPSWGWRVLLAAVVALQLSVGVRFLVLDQAEPWLASLDYTERALELRWRLIHGPQTVSGWTDAVLMTTAHRPPLLMLIAQPGMALLGETTQAAAWQLPLWTAALLLGTFWLGRELSGERAGVVAATLVGCCPIVLGHRGLFMPFLPLAAVTVVGMALLRVEARGSHRRLRLLLAAWIGVGLLLRAEIVVWLGAALVAELWVTGPGSRWRRLRGWLWVAWVPLLMAGWWYGVQVAEKLEAWRDLGLMQTSHAHEDNVELLSLSNLLYYPTRLGPFLTGWPLAAIALVAAPLAWRGADRDARTLLVCWLVLPWLFVLLIPMKSARYVIGWAPAIALIVALALEAMSWRRSLAVAAAGLALLQTGWLLAGPREPAAVRACWPSLGLRLEQRGYRFMAWEDAQDYGSLRPLRDARWRACLDQVERKVDTVARQIGRQPALLMAELPINGYLTALRARRPGMIHLLRLPGGQVELALPRFDLILVAGPGEAGAQGLGPVSEPDAASQQRAAEVQRALRLLRWELRQRRVMLRVALPDGSEARLFGPRRW